MVTPVCDLQDVALDAFFKHVNSVNCSFQWQIERAKSIYVGGDMARLFASGVLTAYLH